MTATATRLGASRPSLWRAAACVALLLPLAAPALAEVRVLEVVGAIPLDAAARSKGIPKDRAIEEALWEGVSRVAEDLLVDSILSASDWNGAGA